MVSKLMIIERSIRCAFTVKYLFRMVT